MLKTIKPTDLNVNVFDLFDKQWALLSAGNLIDLNTMTISWGHLGVLWKRYICIVYVRKTRHTFNYMENNDYFTVSFYDEKYKDILKYCGTKSGRDVNKVKENNLHPVAIDNTITFAEASMTIVCKKIYTEDIKPIQFIDPTIENSYPRKDYHRVYYGEIVNIYESK